MKLIFVVPSFYDDRLPKKVKTGQAIIARELCSSFSEKADVFVTGYPVKSKDLGYADIISTGLVSLIQYVQVRDIKDALSIIAVNSKMSGYRAGIKEGAKTVFYKALSRKFARYVKRNPRDVVAIHDFGQGNLEVLKKCVEMKLKCVVTLHMYVGKYTTLIGKTYLDRAEREDYLFTKTNVPITVVSSGLKRRILEDYSNVSPERITVISNGTRLPDVCPGEGRYVEDKRKLFLCIGTISDRKNQIQLLHALNYLPKEIRKRVKVLFIGVDSLDGKLQKEIIEGGYQDVAKYVGAVEHEKMSSYFESAFAVISTSLNEAFGLTFIEGFTYGIPAIFFDDIDAAEELYDPDAVELIRGKRCNDIVNAISAMVDKSWDREKIKRHATKFDIRKISDEYEDFYRMVCSAC